jgi:FtsH-binding integral membrane protein
MQEPVLIAAVITAVLFLAVSLGYLVAKKAMWLGISYTGSGIFLALLLTVNYFVEIPWPFFAAGFASTFVSGLLGAFEIARKTRDRSPT